MCVFCQIVKGDIPSFKLYEDDDVLAILDISQTTKGHTLVMPKKHYDNILEVDQETLHKVIDVAQVMAKKITENLDAKGFNILVNTNEVAGQTVKHMHLHIIPRFNENDTVEFKFNENKLDLESIKKQILQ